MRTTARGSPCGDGLCSTEVSVIRSLAESGELIEVVSVNRPVLVALVKKPLRFGAQAGHPSAAQFPNGEPGAVEVVVTALESCLPRTSIRVEQQRVHVDPS